MVLEKTLESPLCHKDIQPVHSKGDQYKNTGVGCHFLLQCMKVKNESEVAQSCPTRSDPMDCSLPGSSIHEIFQARVLEWGAIAFSGSSAGAHLPDAKPRLQAPRGNDTTGYLIVACATHYDPVVHPHSISHTCVTEILYYDELPQTWLVA